MNGVPLLCEINYFYWKRRMKVYLEEEAIGMWQSVLTGYTPPKKLKTTAQKEAKKNNSMAMETILEGLHISKRRR